MTEEVDSGIAIPNEDAPAYSQEEQQAMDMGWKPDGVEGKENLSAKEFIGRQPIYDDVRSLKKAHKRDRESIEAMKSMIEGVRQREREKTIAELNSQKKQALEEENYDGVIAIDEKIAEERKSVEPQRNPAYEEWIEKNEWYNTESEMKTFAEDIAAGYSNRNQDKSPAEVYKYVAEEVKLRFPDFFEEPTRHNPVEGARKGRGGGVQYSTGDLNETERGIMKTLLRDGVFKTEQEFMKSYSES